MSDENQPKPLRDRTPNLLAAVRGSLEHSRSELGRMVVRAVNEEDREHYVRAVAFISRALLEIE